MKEAYMFLNNSDKKADKNILYDLINNITKGIEETKKEAKKIEIEVKNSNNLLVYYIRNMGNDNSVPTRNEIIEGTGITEYRLKELNKELKDKNLIKTEGKKVYVI